MEKPIEKNECKHKKDIVPFGQNVVTMPGQLLVIMSAWCKECGDISVVTHPIKMNLPQTQLVQAPPLPDNFLKK